MTQEVKHTPGPWTLGTHEGYEQADIATVYCVPTQPTENGLGQEWLYVIAQKPGFDISAEEQLANARLISAAPELLSLVERAVDALATYIVPDSGITEHDVVNHLLGIFDGPEYRAAIGKVRGAA